MGGGRASGAGWTPARTGFGTQAGGPQGSQPDQRGGSSPIYCHPVCSNTHQKNIKNSGLCTSAYGAMYHGMAFELERRLQNYIPEPNSGCWLWAGRLCGGGYGSLKVDGRRCQAHRASWEFHIGPIPAGLLACHKCDNPPCINPSHIFLGTHRDNLRDMVAKGRVCKNNPSHRELHQVCGIKTRSSWAHVA